MQSPEQLLQGLSVTLQHLGWRKTDSGVYRFRCPYCQHDSYAPGYIHKGYLHPEKGSPDRWRFKCHRCGMATTLLDFVREHAAHLLLPTPEVLEVPPQESIDACGDEVRVTRFHLRRASLMPSGDHGIYRDISTGVIEGSLVMSTSSPYSPALKLS